MLLEHEERTAHHHKLASATVEPNAEPCITDTSDRWVSTCTQSTYDMVAAPQPIL